MDMIYFQARCVLICIDDPSQGLLLPDGSRRPPNYNRLFRWLRNDVSSNHSDVETFLGLDLQHLLSSPYFRRIWVIHEVALARAVYLRVDDQTIPLTAEVMVRLNHLCKHVHEHYELPSVLRWSFDQTTKLDIITCLHACRKCDATDPRDNVYAVLSLMEPQTRALIPVDYSLTLEDTWKNAISAIIITRGSPDLLLYTHEYEPRGFVAEGQTLMRHYPCTLGAISPEIGLSSLVRDKEC
jgi:hypothetical protein